MTKFVYLAGPVTGLTFQEAVAWRNEAAVALANMTNGHVQALDPLRGLTPSDFQSHAQGWFDSARCTAASFMIRDLYDIDRSCCLLANLVGMKSPSIGTMIELGYAFAKNVPIFLVAEKDIHPWVTRMSAERFSGITPALQAIAHLFRAP